MLDGRNLLIVALVGAAAFFAGRSLGEPTALGQGYPGGTADSNGRMIAVTGTVGSGVSVLYVIDTVSGHLAVYQSKGGKSIELVAARKIEWDLKVEGFHDDSLYSPKRLRDLYMDQSKSGASKPSKKPEKSGQSGSPK